MSIPVATPAQIAKMKLRPAVKADFVLDARFLATDSKKRKVIARYAADSYICEGRTRLKIARIPNAWDCKRNRTSAVRVSIADCQLILG
jgi:hypothetical protein